MIQTQRPFENSRQIVKKGFRCNSMIEQVTRLNFWFHKSRSRLSIFLREHLPHHQEKADEAVFEFEDTDCSEELQEFSRTLAEEYEEYINSEPVLVPQTTILFAGQDRGRRCNFLTARRYRTYIRLSYVWARKQGITTFVVDYTTAFGLLAMETLLELRGKGADFLLYAINSRHFAKRKSYRLIPETDIEIAWDLSKCDYRYQCTYSADTLYRIYSSVGMRCAEDGIHRKRQISDPCGG